MPTRSLYRWSGGTLIASSILLIIEVVVSNLMCPGHACTRQVEMGLPWLLVGLTWLVGSVLFVIAFPGMYLRQAGRAGALGFAGFILVFLAVLLGEAAFSLLQIIVLPYLAQHAPQLVAENSGPPALLVLFIVAPVMITIGSILLGIATMRARVFPRWAGILLLVSGIVFLLTIPPLPSPLGDILEVVAFVTFDVSFLGCGYTLIAGEQRAVEAMPVTAEAPASR